MKLPILCYHMVGDIGRRLNIEPARLDSHVRFFSRRGYSVILPVNGFLSTPRAVCFTFDDAYASALCHAVPIFERYDARCAFFAVSSLVGKSSSWDGDLARPLADWEELRRAHERGFLIGNHTATHPRMSDIDSARQEEEVSSCRAELESHGMDSGVFCYPYGAVNDSAREAVGRHYGIGLALVKRPATSADDLLALPRIVVAYSDALPKLLYKIHLRPHLP